MFIQIDDGFTTGFIRQGFKCATRACRKEARHLGGVRIQPAKKKYQVSTARESNAGRVRPAGPNCCPKAAQNTKIDLRTFFSSKNSRRRAEKRKTKQKKQKKKPPACRGEGSAVGLQLRVRFVPAALLAAGCAKDCTGSPVRF
jgi:hypothetical protein